ncbi:MAG TPA: response regulator [Chthoniobacteraceae bacterium]|nr:response regulator [Chthoniobacteraceae bacterium]
MSLSVCVPPMESSEPAESAAAHPHRRLRLLIADDDRVFAEFLAELCVTAGHEVVAIESNGGLAVLNKFLTYRPEVVLLDVIMPKFNGFTIAQHLRSRDEGVRIIMMSGLVQEDYPSAKACKPDVWLQKPITYEALCTALDGLKVQNGSK